ncbi:MAG: outer membrane protein assembly factor BamE [Holosporales bacterium]|jgi:outer membrane protein assembly factor BamE (lipoprotein component of BamABCDE complex)|nr:outer membrane protein assembly factor BamE [Holosporales bacterium]
MKGLLLFFFIVLLGFTACEKVVVNRGYVVQLADFSKIVVGKDTARSVFSRFGSPTMRSSVKADNGEYSWYYVSKRMEKDGFLDPKVIDQKTMVITFGADGIVRSVRESTYERPVSVVTEKTKTEGKTKGVVSETFGGLGKYMNRYLDKGK